MTSLPSTCTIHAHDHSKTHTHTHTHQSPMHTHTHAHPHTHPHTHTHRYTHATHARTQQSTHCSPWHWMKLASICFFSWLTIHSIGSVDPDKSIDPGLTFVPSCFFLVIESLGFISVASCDSPRNALLEAFKIIVTWKRIHDCSVELQFSVVSLFQ